MTGPLPPAPWDKFTWFWGVICITLILLITSTMGPMNNYLIIGTSSTFFLLLNLECHENSPVEKLVKKYGDNLVGTIFLILLVISFVIMFKGISFLEPPLLTS